MSARSWALGVAVLVTIQACKGEAEKPQASAAPSAAGVSVKEKMIGDWVVVLDEKQKREQKVLMLAVQEREPTPEEMTALQLDEREKNTVLAMRQHKKDNPTDPQLEQVKKVVENVGGSSMKISTSTLSMDIGGIKKDAVYQIVEATADKVTIKAKAASGREETLIFRMPAEDRLSMSKAETPGEVLIFERARPNAP